MKKFFVLPMVLALSVFWSCQKQQTEAERQADIQREVQRQLDAEHQAQEKEQVAQRQSDLDAREKELAAKESAAKQKVETERRTVQPQRPAPTSERSERPTGSYSTFYTKLEPHGDWRETSDYGYVWQPREAQSRNWRPYTNGHWVYSDVGWTWVSEEPFGWATYHYGRWTRLRNIGWVWVPGDEWAPAWVSWRKNDEYVGWAPLPPEARFDRRSGIHNWSDSYYDIGPDQYSFVATKEFGGERIQRSVVPSERNITIVNQTTNVTNITYSNTTVVNQGPSYDELRTRTQQPIQRVRLEREVNVNINVGEPRAVVRGEVLFIPAPLIARGQAVERPRAVKETVAHVEIDRGWEGIADRQAVEKTRVKMKSEAPPPADAPSKIFVKPAQAAVEASAPPATSTSASAAVSATQAPAATATATVAPSATIIPIQPARVTQTPEPSATVAATATPFRRQPKPLETVTPLPSASATAAETTASPSATFSPRARPTPPAVIRARPSVRPESNLPVESSSATATPAAATSTSSEFPPPRALQERRRNRPQLAITPPESSPTASVAATATPFEGREGQRPNRPPGRAASEASAPPTSDNAAATASASPPELSRKQERKERKRERRREGEAEASPSPSASAEPQ